MTSSFYGRASLSCSGRLSFNLLRSLSLFLLLRRRIDRFVYYPSESPHLLLVLLLSVYVNLVKELFLSAFTTRRFCTFIFSESECKGTTIFRISQIFLKLFSEKFLKPLKIDKYQEPVTRVFGTIPYSIYRVSLLHLPLPLHFRIYDIYEFCFIIQ